MRWRNRAALRLFALVILLVWFVAGIGPRTVLAQPAPTVTIEPTTINVFPGESFTFDVIFDNTATPNSGDIGYRPAFELVMPSDFTFTSAESLTFGALAPVQTTIVPASGEVTNSLTGEVVSGLPVDATYLLFELPTSSFSPEQVSDTITITGEISATVVPDEVPLENPVTATALFINGDDPSGTTPIRQAPAATATIVPALYIPYKDVATRFGEDETVTGPNYPITYTLGADIAPGASITNLQFDEELPENLQFSGVTSITLAAAGDPNIIVEFNPEGPALPQILYAGPLSGAVFPLDGPGTATSNDPGGELRVLLSVASGTTGDTDVEIVFDSFVPEFASDDTTPIIDPATGGDVPVTNVLMTMATEGTGPFGTIDLTPFDKTTEPVTIQARNIAIQKSVEVETDNNVAGVSPQDVVRFTLQAQISDYFQHDQIAVQDVLGDGYDYIANSGQMTVLTENGTVSGATPLAYADQAQDPALDVSGGAYPAPLPTGTVLVTQNAQPGQAAGATAGYTTLLFDVSGLEAGGSPIGLLTGGAFNGDTTNADGYLTGVDDETRLALTFAATIQTEYDNPVSFPGGDANIDSFDVLSNDALVSGRIRDAGGGGEFDTDSTNSEQVIAEPDLGKSLVALNGAEAGAPPVEVRPGDTLTFELRVDIPTGNLETLTLSDYLPSPYLDVTEIDTTFDGACAGFPAAGDVCYAADTTTPPLGTAPTITVSPAENAVYFTWPDNTTFVSDPPQAIVVAIQFTATVTNEQVRDNQTTANVAGGVYGNSADESRADQDSAPFVVREPVIEIDKSVAPTTADAGDTLTYTIAVTNTGGADAYDVAVLDETFATLPLTGCTVVSTQDGGGTDIPTSGSLFGPSPGLAIGEPIPPDGQVVITVTCVATEAVEPGSSYVNTSEVPQFFNEDDSDGDRTNFVDPADPPMDDAEFTGTDPGIVKTIVATDQAFTDGNDVAIGEIVSYEVVVTVPEGTSTNVVFRDTLDRGLAFVDGSFAAVGSNDPDMPISPGAPVYSNPSAEGDQVDGRLEVDFGTIINSNTDDGVDETITITYQAVVLNNSTNNLDPATQINNDAEWYWSDASTDGGCSPSDETCVQASAPNVTIQEAQFTVEKTNSVDQADAGDPVTATIVVTNTGTTDAFEVVLTDVVPDGLTYDPGTFMNTAGLAPDTTDDSDPEGAGLSASWATFPAGETSTFTFVMIVDDDVTAGNEAVNTATVTWSSLAGDVDSIVTPNGNTFACERTDPDDATTCAGGDASDDYIASGSDDGTVLLPTAIGKQLLSTSETVDGDSDPGDANLDSNPPVQIGEILTYRMAFEIPEAVVPGVVLADVLEAPAVAGTLELVSATLARDSAGLTTGLNPGGVNDQPVDTPVPVTLVDGANEFTLDLGTVTNTDTDADPELYILVVTYHVANIAENSAGAIITDHGELRAQGGPTIATNPVSVHVAEPVVVVDKDVSPSSITGGSVVTFTLTITNAAPPGEANSATAFDWTITDPLPVEYTSPSVTNTDDMGTGATINASFSGNTLSATIDELNPGESVTIEYQATVDPTVEFGDEITNTVTAEATSLRADDDPNERTGEGGVNDLVDTSSRTTSTGLPSISKTISPLENPYAIGEVATFEIHVGVPVGSAENLVVTDVLDAGLVYQPGTLSVALPAGSSATNTPLDDSNGTFFDYDTGTNTFTLSFGTLTIATAGDVVITYDAVVGNILDNQTGTSLANSAAMSFDDINNPGQSITDGPVSPEDNVIVGEPNLEMSKLITAGAVGATAGDTVSWQVEITNTGNTTAYQVNWTDIMPDGPAGPPDNDGLYNIMNPLISISGGDVFLNGTATAPTAADFTISTTTNPDDTVALAPIQIAPGATVTISFDTTAGDDVQPLEVLVNDTDVDYASLPVDTGNERDGSDGGDDDDSTPLNNYNEATSEALTIDAELAIDKTVSPVTYTIGETVTYEIVVSVIQGTTADVVVTDTLPAGVTYVSHTISGGCYGNANAVIMPGNPDFNDRLGTGQTVEFDFGDVSNPDDGDLTNDCFTVAITGQVENVAGNQNLTVLGNSVSVSAVDAGSNPYTIEFDAFPAIPGIQPLPIVVVEPVLQITKSVEPTEQSLGDIVTYTVRVEHGPLSTADAYDIQIVDTLPAGLTYEDGSAILPDGGTVSPSGQVLTFDFASLTLADGYFEYSYQARVDLTAVVDQPLTNTALMTWTSLPDATGAQDSGRTGADGPGGALNDYAVEDDAAVTPTAAAITIDKTVADITGDPDFTEPGDILEYTVVVTNTNGDLTGVVVTDPIPVNTTYVAGTLAVTSGNGTPDDSGDPLIVDIGPMAPADVTIFTFQVQVDAFTPSGTFIENVATVDSDQTVPASDDAFVPVGVEPMPGLRAEKRVMLSDDVVPPMDGTINVGDEVTYTITITNTGDVDLNNLNFSDTLPEGWDFVSFTAPDWDCTITPGVTDAVDCSYVANGGVFPVGGVSEITLVGTAIEVSTGEPTGTWVNQGTATSDETDPTPTDGNSDPTDGFQPTEFPVLPPDEAGTPEIDVFKSVVIATENNGDGQLNPGETIRYFITVLNTGTAPATNVVLIDDIPVDTTLIAPGVTTDTGIVVNPASQPPPDIPEPLEIEVNIGTIPVAGLATITIDLRVDADHPAPDIVSNQAFTDFDDNPDDPVPSDDPSTDDTDDPTDIPVVVPPDFNPPVGVKTVDGATYPDLTWEMTWINSQNDTPLNTRVTDPIPDDTTYVDGSVNCEATGASTTQICEFDAANNQIVWEGTLGPDLGAAGPDDAANEVVITFQTTVAEGVDEVFNQGCAFWDSDGDGFIGGPGGDPDEADQVQVCTDDPFTPDPFDPTPWRAPDLTVDKSRASDFVIGEQGTYELLVSNVGEGPSAGTITVTDVLPEGLEYVSASGDGWTCGYDDGSRTITCTTVAILLPGESLPPISVVVEITPAAFPTVTNPVHVDGNGDLNPDNDDDEDTITFDGPDLAIDKSHTGEFLVGQEADFQIVVTNVGVEPTFDPITVTDTLPDGLEYVNASGDGWDCDYNDGNRTVTCTTETVLQPGESLPPITLTVFVTADAFPSVVNTAETDTDGDNNDDNDSDDDEIIIDGGPDLSIDKSHETDFTVGEENTYHLDITNVGGATTLEPTVVTDDVPDELIVVSASGDGWDCSVAGQLVTCVYDEPIEPGETVSIDITVIPTDEAEGEIVNIADVDNPDDTNPENDEDDDRTDIIVPDDDDGPDWDGDTDPGLLCTEECSAGSIFYPWVANDDDFGLGPADTAITVQNLENRDAYIFVYRGVGEGSLTGDNGWDLVGVTFLSRYASKTFTAEQLGLAPGQGAPIGVSAYHKVFMSGGQCSTLIGGPLEAGNDVNDTDSCTDVEVPSRIEVDGALTDVCLVDDAAGNPAAFFGTDGRLYQDRAGLPEGVYPAGLNNDNDCGDSESIAGGELVIDQVAIGGYAKQASTGEDLPYTTTADEVVDGYNAVSCHEIAEYDDWYLPIVQTNVGPGGAWNTIIRVANYGNYDDDGTFEGVGSAAVTLRFFPADDGSGSLATGFQLQHLINAGDTLNINLSEHVPEGWVGSVHVYSDGAIFTMADRYKTAEYDVWLTTTGTNAGHEASYNQNEGGAQIAPYVLFAPDVRFDYYGWNTGINVANLVNEDNNVTIQYFNQFGTAPSTLTRRLGPQGMTYFYDPSQPGQNNSTQDPTTDVNAGIVGSALIWSEHPIAVAVDATKYPESDPNAQVGRIQGTTYNATANIYNWQAVPLVQKGNPASGLGATSGINIMNPNSVVTQATVHWFNPSGAQADNFGTSVVAIPAYANGFVYTMTQGNLPSGYYGSAVVTSTYPVAATSAQVDYQVGDDGAVIWNSYNPGGFYRISGCYDFGDVFDQPTGGSVKKFFTDDTGAPVTGVNVTLYNEAAYEQIVRENESFVGIPWLAVGTSDINGEVLWTNVPEGNYWLQIDAVPQNAQNTDMYTGAGRVEGPFTLTAGQDLVIENVLRRHLPAKTVMLGAGVDGVEVCLHLDADNDAMLDPEETDNPVDCSQTGPEGTTTFAGFEPGRYWVSVNSGYEFPVDLSLSSGVFGPEVFELGGSYENDLSGSIGVVEGAIQKVLVVPAFVANLINAGRAQITGSITINGPEGAEVIGNIQTERLDSIGPDNQAAYSLTDYGVVAGAYTIEEEITLTIDADGDPDTPPAVFTLADTLESTDAQVVCPGATSQTSQCEASPDAPEIVVYDGQTTRVFNDISSVVLGQLDVFVRDDEIDSPVADATVCLYTAENVEVGCSQTDGDGQAEFADLAGGIYSLTVSAAGYETDGSGQFPYLVFFDGVFGGGLDDEIGDVDFFGAQQDIAIAIDPEEVVEP